jgi:hypothetical protein
MSKAIVEATMKNIIEAESLISEQVRIINEYVVHFALIKKVVEKYDKLEWTEEQTRLENLRQTTQLLSSIKK